MGFPNVAQVIRDPKSIVEQFVPFQVLLDTIPIDVLSAERISVDWDITEKPVQEGLPVTDSRKKKPEVLQIEGLQTDDKFALTITDITSLLDGIQSWQDKKEQIEELYNRDQIVTVTTPMRVYKNMMIRSFNADRTPANAYQNGFIFRMTLKEVRITSSDVQEIDKSQIPESLIAKEKEENTTQNKRRNKKKIQNKKTPEITSEKKKSIALSLVEKLGGV